MADYQRVVEFLRDIRTAPPGQVTDELRQYARQYAEICTAANERLRRCSMFLQQGLRSEAIHLAEEPPNLLDLVAALDLPEPEAWAEFCRNADLPIPPPLQMDRAGQLNDAYTADQPMEALLAEHRVLALSRAGVKERLELLRKIAAQDSAGAFWEKDIRLFETARIRELPNAFYTAVKNRDDQTVAALHKEVFDSPWLEVVPDDIRGALSGANVKMKRAVVEDQLRGMLESLQAAYREGSVSGCSLLLKEWQKIMDEAELKALSPELTAQVDPIRAWVKQQESAASRRKKSAAAAAKLGNLLAAHGPDAEIDAVYAELQKIDDPISAELQARYEEHHKKQAMETTRRYRAKYFAIGSVAAAVVLIAVGIAVLYARSTSATAWAQRIHAANMSRDLVSANRIINELQTRSPQLAGTHEVQAAEAETTALRQKSQADSDALHTLLGQMQQAIDAASQATGDPNATPQGLLQAAAQAGQTLAAFPPAADLAWVDPQDQRAELRAKLAASVDVLKAAANALVKTQSAALARQLDAINGPNAQESVDQISAIYAKASALAGLSGIDDSGRQAANDLVASAQQHLQSMHDSVAQQTQYAALAAQATSADALGKALHDFTAKFPNAAATADFNAAMDLIDSAKGVEAWADMTSHWTGSLAPPTAAEAQDRLKALQAYMAAHPGSPFSPAAANYITYLAHAADALAEKSAWQTAFDDLLDKPMITDLEYMQTSDGTRYYVLGDPHCVESHIGERSSISFNALDPNDLSKRQLISVDPPLKLVTPKPVLTAHSKFATQAADQIKLINDKNWETFGMDLMDRLAAADDIDPAVRGMFLEVAISTTQQLDGWAINDLYDQSARDLARQEVGKIIWYDPAHPVSDGTRQALKSIFDHLPKSADARQQLADAKANLFQKIRFTYSATGVLLHDSQDRPALTLNGSPVNGAVLWAAGPMSADSPKIALWTRLGQVKNGQPELDAAEAAKLPQGTMVFAARQ